MDATKLKIWLPFDKSATADKCGNSWTTYGTTSIDDTNAINSNALQLNKGYLRSDTVIEFGGADFTVDFYGYMNSSSESYAGFFCAQSTTNTDEGGRPGQLSLYRNGSSEQLHIETYNSSGTQTANVNISNDGLTNARHHFELDYSHANSTLKIFVDGALTLTRSITVERSPRYIFLGTNSYTPSSQRMIGTIDEFRLFDGVALHSENFTPPTAAEYEELAFQLDSHVSFTVDVERRISNCVEFTADVERTVIAAWRYFNAGTADTLTVTGTTLTDLPETKSVTGTAFYQTAREKCFDLPTTPEVWIKFDVYFDGSARWRAYNGGNNGVTGITAQTDLGLSYFSNGGSQIYNTLTALKKNTLQTVLLHMVSGSSAGVVEAWVDGTKIYTYTGDVNHGEDFADIYLQSDGSGTFFSNVSISNREIGLNDGYISFTADVQRKLSNIVEFTADVQRGIMEVINVPFIFGDHFNHCCSVEYDAPTTSIGRPLKIKLPNKSKAYVHATALNGGAFKVFSDTDAVGTVTGDVYAALDECESVFVQKVVAPQSILYMFLNSLRYRGGSALDSAIENCTYGVFPSKDELVNSFLNDLDNSESNLDFLSRCCGVDLSNDDTGAVIGSDAGGGYPKTAKSIVPEPVPVEDWIVPEKGSSKTIAGLTVYFPTSGYKGTLTDAENHILAGLNSVWIEQALLLIQRSCNIDFRTNQTNIVHDISVKFVDENNDALAYVSITTKDGSTTSLELRVNMRRYSGINMTSEDGAAGSNTYLDRVLAHEMTHAVMAARIKNYTELPRFLREGIAEFIHGIDDERKSDIQYLTQTAQRNTLQSIFSTGGDSGDINIYSAGYLFFRYMIKQTLEKGTFPLERYSSTGHIRLFISDGAVDYFGNALTDNTRATLIAADTLRELVKSTSLTADVEIFDMIPVEFAADINRAIKGKVKLFTVDNSEYFSGSDNSGTLQPVVIPPQETIPAAPDNTNVLQSVEISLSEQQLTDNVSFVGVVPFDIMFPVQGQYLDYVFDMRVERVQQRGVLYTCDCCVDVDQLLYTQIAYTVPKSTDWHGAGDSSTATTTQDDKSVLASYHASSIARTIGKTPVIQFVDFSSTVLTENLGGATYADLIRDVFGWSSRVPTHMINVFIRNDKIYFVQRGHEARLIDLTGTHHTIPIVTHELVRMTWGSTPWSKTETREVEKYRPPTTSASGTGTGSGDGSGSGSIGDGVSSISGGADKVIKYKGGGDQPAIPVNDDGEEENVGVLTVSDSFVGYPESGHTTYSYDGRGLLVQTFTYVHNHETGKNTYTTVNQDYDEDGTLISSWTFVQSMDGHGDAAGYSSSSTTISKGYIKLDNGEKFLARESSVTYASDNSLTPTDLVESKTVIHSPSRAGQGRATVIEDGEFSGGIVGQNTGDDRVTPYRHGQAKKLAETALENSLKAAGKNTSGSGSGSGGTIAGGASTPEEIYAAYQANHEADYYTERQSRTLNGLSLYDSSFPIHNVGKLMELTEAIRWLNRRTKETVTMTIYEYPHLIDFNDRILFNGAQYFLVSNVAMTNARVFNEQRVTFTRWY